MIISYSKTAREFRDEMVNDARDMASREKPYGKTQRDKLVADTRCKTLEYFAGLHGYQLSKHQRLMHKVCGLTWSQASCIGVTCNAEVLM